MLATGIEYREEILQLKKELNAVLLAHYYQEGPIQDIADIVGDSLELARRAAEGHRAMSVLWPGQSQVRPFL